MVSRCGDHLHHFVQELKVKNCPSTGAVISFQPIALDRYFDVDGCVLCFLFVATIKLVYFRGFLTLLKLDL